MKSQQKGRQTERLILAYLMGYLTIICFGSSIGIALSTSLLINQVGATKLPWIFVGISVISLLLSGFYTQWIPRFGAQGFYQRFLWISCIFIVICNLFLRTDLTVAGVNPGVFSQYLAFFVILGLEMMHFSTYSQEYLNPLQRKRLYPLILSATKFGGILGGLAIAPLLERFGSENLLLLWAASYPIAAFLLRKFESSVEPISRDRRGSRFKSPTMLVTLREGFSELFNNPYIFWFSMAIFLDIFGGSILTYMANEGLVEDFAFKGKPDELSAFLGKFAAAANGIALGLQVFVAPFLIRKLAVPTSNYIYPVFGSIVLLLCIFKWNLPLVVILMFYRDYFFSVLHHPNRTLFYNGIDPEKRALFVGFLEGVWESIANFLVGVLLLILVEFGPHTRWFSDGKFAFELSILAFIASLVSVFTARKLQILHPKALLNLVASKDLGSKITKFRFSDQESTKLINSEKDIVSLAKWLPALNTNTHIDKIIHLQSEDLINMLLSKTNIEWSETLEHIQKNKPPTPEIQMAIKADRLYQLIAQKLETSASHAELCEFILVHQRMDLLPELEKSLLRVNRRLQLWILKIFNFFTYEVSNQTSEFLVEKFSNFDNDSQRIILSLLVQANHDRSMPWICSLFESRSKALRSSALGTVVNFLKKSYRATELTAIYQQRKWSPEAGECWYRIFNSQPNQFQNVLETMKTRESETLISHCSRMKVLDIHEWQKSMLYLAISEDIRSRIRFFLNFFSTEYDLETLTILERALGQPNSSRKFEALELLQSSKNKNLANLLTPFMEFDSYSEILDNLPKINQDLPTIQELLKDCLEGENSWIRACALHDIGNREMTDFKFLVEKLSKERVDLTSQEMALVCLRKWETAKGSLDHA